MQLMINTEKTCTTNQDCFQSIKQTQLQHQITSIHHNTTKRLINPDFLKIFIKVQIRRGRLDT